MSARERTDPLGVHRFEVDLGPDGTVGFSAVRGLSVSVEIQSAEEDDDGHDAVDSWWPLSEWFDQYREYLPAPVRRRTQSPTLELRRGVTADTTLWDWLQDWVAGRTEQRDVHVVLNDTGGQPVRAWLCRGARPVEWTGPELVATRSQVATETLELAHDGIEHVSELSRWGDGSA